MGLNITATIFIAKPTGLRITHEADIVRGVNINIFNRKRRLSINIRTIAIQNLNSTGLTVRGEHTIRSDRTAGFILQVKITILRQNSRAARQIGTGRRKGHLLAGQATVRLALNGGMVKNTISFIIRGNHQSSTDIALAAVAGGIAADQLAAALVLR